MMLEPIPNSSPEIPDISSQILRYESLCLDLIAKACAEVRKAMPTNQDLLSSTSSASFAFIAGGWVRDKVAVH